MLLYLDSRDLINVFTYRTPIDHQELKRLLLERETKLIYSEENIREIVKRNDLEESRFRLAVMQDLPRLYVRGRKEIVRQELIYALSAFNSGEPAKTIYPFVTSWQLRFTIPLDLAFSESPTDSLVEDILVHLQTNPDLFRNTPEQSDQLKTLVVDDRLNERMLEVQSKAIFRDDVGYQLAKSGLPQNEAYVTRFAAWLFTQPSICPGWRLLRETYSAYCKNVRDQGQLGDTPDFGHVFNTPYVDAITLDARMEGYTRSAARQLSLLQPETNYSTRLFSSLKSWLES